MSLIQYFRAVFGGSSVSIFETIQRVDSLIHSIFENLPRTLFIQNLREEVGFQIDLTQDNKISYEEYSALHSVFSQFVTATDPEIKVSCTCGPLGQTRDFNDLLKEYPGIYRIIRSTLFLDFHNAPEFINNSIALYELISPPKFSLLPSTDRRDSYMAQAKEMNQRLLQHESEFDAYTVDYSKFTRDIDTLGHMITQIEADIAVQNQEFVEKTSEILVKSDLQEDSRRISKLMDKLSRSLDVNNDRILEITKKNRITVTDSSRQKELRRINARRVGLIESLNGRQAAILQEIDQKAKEAMLKGISGEVDSVRGDKLQELKSSLSLAEERRRQVHGAMTDMKKKINALKLEILEVESKMKSDGAPVDMNRISSENILRLDTESTLHEKTARFLLSYFTAIEPRGFLTIPQRRELLKKIYPELTIKSISLGGGAVDYQNFIEVSA